MRKQSRGAGFSLIEMMIVMAIFMVISGAVFGLLNASQVRYRSEQQVVEALQGARVAVSQMTRDIHKAGYPPANAYDISAAGFAGVVPANQVAVPFWSTPANCTINTLNPAASTCIVPNPFELVIEADIDPQNAISPEQVEWIYYRVEMPGGAAAPAAPAGGGTARTLYRMISEKVAGGDPRIQGVATYRAARALLTPLVENVVNDPAAWPADPDERVFRYWCGAGLTTCTANNIQGVFIVLRVQSRFPDPTRTVNTLGELNYRAVTLQSVSRPMNPAQ